MRQFSNEDLTAFLDGEADRDLSRDIQKALETDGALAQRLANLHLDKDELRNAFDELLNDAPLPPVSESVTQTPPSRLSGFLKIAAAALIAVGAGWYVGETQGSDLNEWQDYAAAYHKLYVDETLGGTSFSESELRSQLSATLSAIESDLSYEDIQSIDGLTLKRSQILGFAGGKIAHIAMTDAQGHPIALCIMKADEADVASFEETLGMQAARWSLDGHSYYLIGGRDAALIKSATKQLSELG